MYFNGKYILVLDRDTFRLELDYMSIMHIKNLPREWRSNQWGCRLCRLGWPKGKHPCNSPKGGSEKSIFRMWGGEGTYWDPGWQLRWSLFEGFLAARAQQRADSTPTAFNSTPTATQQPPNWPESPPSVFFKWGVVDVLCLCHSFLFFENLFFFRGEKILIFLGGENP